MIEMLGGSVVPPSNFQFVATIVADNQPFTIIFPRPRGGAYAHPREGITKKIHQKNKLWYNLLWSLRPDTEMRMQLRKTAS